MLYFKISETVMNVYTFIVPRKRKKGKKNSQKTMEPHSSSQTLDFVQVRMIHVPLIPKTWSVLKKRDLIIYREFETGAPNLAKFLGARSGRLLGFPSKPVLVIKPISGYYLFQFRKNKTLYFPQ